MDSPSLMLEKVERINTEYVWNKGNGAVEHGMINGCVPFSHQVAGHKCGINNTGVLQHPDGTILKQLQPPPRPTRDVILQAEQYLKLEDVTQRFLQPCIMDVKIGRRSYDPFASQDKREQQIGKYPLMEEIGFLLLGMRVYQINSDSYITHDQSYGRSLGKDTVKNGLTRFFHNGQCLRKDAISHNVFKIRQILHWFESQTQLHFYASSLLLMYEGSPHTVNGMMHKRAETGRQLLQSNGHFPHETQKSVQCSLTQVGRKCIQSNCSDLPHNLQHDRTVNGMYGGSVEEEDEEIGIDYKEENAGDVKMIDFAHVFPSDSADEGYIYGLRNLLATLEQILKE